MISQRELDRKLCQVFNLIDQIDQNRQAENQYFSKLKSIKTELLDYKVSQKEG